MKCLAKRPEDRWPTAGAFAAALEREAACVVDPAATAVCDPPPVRKREPLRVSTARQPRWGAALGVGIGALVVGTAVTWHWHGRQLANSSPRALAPMAKPAEQISASPSAAYAEAGGQPSLPEPIEVPSALPDPPAAPAVERHRAPAPAAARDAETTAAPITIPAPTLPSSSPTPIPPPTSPALHVDLDVVQDSQSTWAAPVLYARLVLDGQALADAALAFTDGSTRVQHALMASDLSLGPHRLAVAVSARDDFGGEATVSGSKEVSLGPGANRLLVRVRFVGPDDWTMRFVQP